MKNFFKERRRNVVLIILVMIITFSGMSMILTTQPASADAAWSGRPTYTIFVHGFSFTSDSNSYNSWFEVNTWDGMPGYVYSVTPAGYYSCWISYYGTPWMQCIDPGNHYFQLSGSSGNAWTSIETISGWVYSLIHDLTNVMGNVNLDVVGYSMGGLVLYYMFEHYYMPNVNVRNVITIDSPLDGSPVANDVVNFQWLCYGAGLLFGVGCSTLASETQIHELEVGSSFVNNLKSYSYAPGTNWWDATWVLIYSDHPTNQFPWWWPDGQIFGSAANDGIVADSSQQWAGVGGNYYYHFSGCHVGQLCGDVLSQWGVTYRVADIVNGWY